MFWRGGSWSQEVSKVGRIEHPGQPPGSSHSLQSIKIEYTPRNFGQALIWGHMSHKKSLDVLCYFVAHCDFYPIFNPQNRGQKSKIIISTYCTEKNTTWPQNCNKMEINFCESCWLQLSPNKSIFKFWEKAENPKYIFWSPRVFSCLRLQC